MKHRGLDLRAPSVALSLCLALAPCALAQTDAAKPGALPGCSEMSLGQNASLNGFVPFPATDPFNQNIASSPVDPSSAAIISALGSAPLHPDFGSGEYNGSYIGIPYQVVGKQARVQVQYQAYGDQSDAGPMPLPANAPVEGYPDNENGDRHVLVLDANNCFLYELDEGYLQSDGSWNADSGAVWDLLADNARPFTWTSADAAGLPIFPGLARYDEVASGAIHHALRFTVAHTRNAFVLPATHEASSSSSAAYPPMGARFRLKAGFDISGFSPQATVILQALKTYGMIVADNGSNMYISGAPNDGWNNDDLHTLSSVPASAFEVVTTSPVLTYNTLPAGQVPEIKSFTASSGSTAVAPGTKVTLDWKVKDESYTVLTPKAGATRAKTATVAPMTTTTYTLYANNHFGSATATVTVTVK